MINTEESHMSKKAAGASERQTELDVREHLAASVFAIFFPCALLCLLVSSMYGTIIDCERDVAAFSASTSGNRSLSMLLGEDGIWIQTIFAAAIILLLLTTQIRMEQPKTSDAVIIFSDEIIQRCSLAFVLATVVSAGPNSLVVMTCGMGAGCCAVANFGILAIFRREITKEAGQRITCAALCMSAIFAGMIVGLLIRHGLAGNLLRHFSRNDPLGMHSLLSASWHEISRAISQIFGK